MGRTPQTFLRAIVALAASNKTLLAGGTLPNVPINTGAGTNVAHSPRVAAHGSNVLSVWENRVSSTSRIFYSTSSDGGATFTEIGEVPPPAVRRIVFLR